MKRVRPAGVLLSLLAVAAAAGFSPGAGRASIAGKITNVDVHTRTLTVADASAKKEVTMLVNEDSVIVLDGDDEAGLDDLYEGDTVQAATVEDIGGGRLLLIEAIVESRPEAGDDDQETSVTMEAAAIPG